MRTHDILIIGGGCSGLALAYHLKKNNTDQKIIILESRKEYTHDKTWCFWEKNENLWTSMATKHWSHWSFHTDSDHQTIKHESQIWKYYHLPAIKYYKHMTQTIRTSNNITLKMNTQVTKITKEKTSLLGPKGTTYQLQTNNDTYRALHVIDTRPQRSGESILFQSFYGFEIEIQASQNDDCVALMHNMRTDDTSFRFNYILPLSKTHMLFEHTRFADSPISEEIMKKECSIEMKRLDIKHQKIIRTEYGLLPMGLKIKPSQFHTGGQRQGALRDASGYAFLRIQRWADAFSKELIKQSDHKTKIPNKNRKDSQKTMDMFFLKTLRREHHDSSKIFMSLAKSAGANLFSRFMSDQSSLMDKIRIIISMPPWPFIKTLFSNPSSQFTRSQKSYD